MLVIDCPPQSETIAQPTGHPGYWMWAAILIGVVVFELWAIWSGHQTMSQVVQRGPVWFRWLVGGGLILLIMHLFVWKP